ncbi:MAG TPA: PHB depolymerase family esterase, partial [Burkholderiaceae bacterium]|nr:PHB depolymerase family esterase [Burkholderiaceae bacterium]
MDISSISQTIDRALVAAGLDTRSGPLKTVASTIEKALAAAGLTQRTAPRAARASATSRAATGAADTDQAVVDVGQFITASHSNGHATRGYKLYVPAAYDGAPMPLIVMLHGCKQNPDDFAAGTRMNEWAEREGFLVAYPAQTARANGANCWNWFEHAQQQRDGDEPAIIAGIVGAIAESHAVDRSRVFVAGLSAGAAMAVILGATYPEVFAAVGAHSGLPIGAAHDVASAFAAMHGRAAAAHGAVADLPAVPTIVIHGDADSTVAASNGDAIVEQALRRFAHSHGVLRKRAQAPVEAAGRSVSKTDYVDAAGRARVEEWVVHGGAHTWFGGDPAGSYTDAAGPDASAQIVRFFLAAK